MTRIATTRTYYIPTRWSISLYTKEECFFLEHDTSSNLLNKITPLATPSRFRMIESNLLIVKLVNF